MTQTVRVALVVATLAVAGGLLTHAGLVNAKGNHGAHAGWANQLDSDDHHTGPTAESTLPERPGHGFGDENHEHTGPPGQSSFPGNGFGDDNHTHTGPPGHD